MFRVKSGGRSLSWCSQSIKNSCLLLGWRSKTWSVYSAQCWVTSLGLSWYLLSKSFKALKNCNKLFLSLGLSFSLSILRNLPQSDAACGTQIAQQRSLHSLQHVARSPHSACLSWHPSLLPRLLMLDSWRRTRSPLAFSLHFPPLFPFFLLPFPRLILCRKSF